MRPFLTLLQFTLICFLSAHSATAEEKNRISVQLFGKDVIGEYDGCHYAFWQSNRDPETDKYPYIFYAPIHDGGELPAWMQIEDKVREMSRIDADRDSGELDAHQLYRSQDGKFTAIVEIEAQRRVGNDILVDRAGITLIQSSRFPFRSEVKGRLGCPQSAYEAVEASELEGDAISLSNPIPFDTISAIPAEIRRYINQNNSECSLEQTAGYGARYEISDAMTLWEIPCALYARNASSVFVTALNENPDYFVVLPVSAAPGSGENDRFDILNASVNPSDASVTSYSLGPGGDCGTFEKHQLRALEGEEIALLMVEFREKIECNGVQDDPANYQLIYSAN